MENIFISVYEDGYWWVQIEDELWAEAKIMDYLNGIPLVYPNRRYK